MIVTRHLVLRPHNLDRRALRKEVRWLNDPEVTKFSEQRHKKHTINSQIAYVTSFVRSLDNLLYQIWCGDTYIGNVNAYVDLLNRVANIGIMVGEKELWGRGYGLDAWQGFSDFLFSRGIRKIEAGCMATNEGMIRLARASGMSLEGRVSRRFVTDDGEIDLLLFGRFR